MLSNCKYCFTAFRHWVLQKKHLVLADNFFHHVSFLFSFEWLHIKIFLQVSLNFDNVKMYIGTVCWYSFGCFEILQYSQNPFLKFTRSISSSADIFLLCLTLIWFYIQEYELCVCCFAYTCDIPLICHNLFVFLLYITVEVFRLFFHSSYSYLLCFHHRGL